MQRSTDGSEHQSKVLAKHSSRSFGAEELRGKNLRGELPHERVAKFLARKRDLRGLNNCVLDNHSSREYAIAEIYTYASGERFKIGAGSRRLRGGRDITGGISSAGNNKKGD